MTDDDDVADAELARRAAKGDDRAFSLLVARHKESLFRLLRRHTGDAEEAYEAVHEAFIAAWGALGRYDPSRPFGAWMRTIAINKARDRGRRMVVRRLLFGAQAFDESGAETRPDPGLLADEALAAREQTRRLDLAIRRLPTALREALLLTAYEGFSQQEAGQILGVSAKTVETRTYRARKILAQTLAPDMRPSQ